MKIIKRYSLFILLIVFTSNCLASDITQNDLSNRNAFQISKNPSIGRELAISFIRAAFVSAFFTSCMILTNKMTGTEPDFTNSQYLKVACGLTGLFVGADIGCAIGKKYREFRDLKRDA